MKDARPTAQPAAERRAAEAELRRMVMKFAPTHLRLVGTARRWLRQRLPTAHEVVYEYRDCFVVSWSPNERGYEGVVALRGSAEGMRLYITKGKGMPDPAKLLRGSAQARWLPLEGAATLARAEVKRLVDEAIARHTVPFPPSGRGQVVVRQTAAKKPARKRRPA